MSATIRTEQPGDIDAIHELTIAAFAGAAHADGTEQFVVRALRDAGALTISWVAETEGQLVGHVAVSPVTVSDGARHWYGLGPISVRPEVQGQGIGAQLMDAAIDALRDINANGCVLLGDPKYYQRFGFKPVKDLALPGVPPDYFQALLLQGEYPRGSVTYHAAFSARS